MVLAGSNGQFGAVINYTLRQWMAQRTAHARACSMKHKMRSILPQDEEVLGTDHSLLGS